MTFVEIVKHINDLKEIKAAIDLLKSLPAYTAEWQEKIIIELNKHLEAELRKYHKLLMEAQIK